MVTMTLKLVESHHEKFFSVRAPQAEALHLDMYYVLPDSTSYLLVVRLDDAYLLTKVQRVA